MDLKEIGCEGVDRIHRARHIFSGSEDDLKLRVSLTVEKFLITYCQMLKNGYAPWKSLILWTILSANSHILKKGDALYKFHEYISFWIQNKFTNWARNMHLLNFGIMFTNIVGL
jgi:hypothetical protein